MNFDHRRLRFGELIAGVSGFVLFVSLFLSWYGVGPFSASAWSASGFISFLLLIVAAVAVGLAVMKALGQKVALPVAPSIVTAALGALAVLLMLFRLVSHPAGFGLRYGIFIGLLAAIGVLVGGYQSMREEGTTLEDAKAQANRAVSSRGGNGPASSGTGAPSSSTTSTAPAPTAPPVAPPAAPTPPPADPAPGTGSPEPPPAQGV